MKKVLIVHGFQGSPNGGWRSWLMGELSKQDIYAYALSMPSPESPVLNEWLEELSRAVVINKNDELYLVGHSLGVVTILRYLEKTHAEYIQGAVLVSGPCQKNNNRKIDGFLETPFNFEVIKSKCKDFCIIHGDNDSHVPLHDAEILSQELNAELIVVKNGGHLNGGAGWVTLPECLEALRKMIN